MTSETQGAGPAALQSSFQLQDGGPVFTDGETEVRVCSDLGMAGVKIPAGCIQGFLCGLTESPALGQKWTEAPGVVGTSVTCTRWNLPVSDEMTPWGGGWRGGGQVRGGCLVLSPGLPGVQPGSWAARLTILPTSATAPGHSELECSLYVMCQAWGWHWQQGNKVCACVMLNAWWELTPLRGESYV